MVSIEEATAGSRTGAGTSSGGEDDDEESSSSSSSSSSEESKDMNVRGGRSPNVRRGG